MAISKMAKVIIVSHRTEATQLLELLQRGGICQILNAEEAMVSRDFPELGIAAERPKDIEELLNRLTRALVFLKDYTESPKGLAAALSPRTVIDQQEYNNVVSDKQVLDIVEQCEQSQAAIEKLKTDSENLHGILAELQPWASLQTPVEELGWLETTTCLTGLLAIQHFEQIQKDLAALDAAVQQIGAAGNKYACLIVCLNEQVNDAQKLLRSADFEAVTLSAMTGTVAELIEQHTQKLNETKKQLQYQYEKAAVLGKDFFKLQILHDHYTNLLSRERTKSNTPATEATVILEGWVREKDYARLEKIVSGFGASSLSRIAPAEGEEIPVEIENNNFVRPFEVVTRLYGMPQHFEVDPTALLAQFFALFFALCLTDAGYGLVLIGLMAFFIRKMQGDKKLMWMLGICSGFTIVAGALTGGWFGDAVQQFIPTLGPLREKLMWFDPMKEPMVFFRLSLALGYLHIMVGLITAFLHNLKQEKFVAAVCDQLTWLVMLNSIVLKLFGAGFGLSPESAAVFGKIAMVPAVIIVLFSQRHGNWAGRIGMGCYKLFSTIFYMGDVLSYLRLMALGMVTGGLAMAFNVMAKTASEEKNIKGYIIMVVILIVGHLFNTAISGLSAFVHTIRLQFVEFFPKFLEGGGTQFKPLMREYKHIYINEK